ncbi:hypothetical protein Syun_020188 [Stephania yunnanensis]|uniref:Uncharacterized protein n=1 Tax=Stephania yunnanensis TaxID=152371 RepID=A0AAP0IDG6_9MAGN
MAGKQMGGETLSSNLAGMSKNQLYDIMSQMKTLIEQNQQQARQILVDNPALTKALFQAQIMLGMVQPPKVMPNLQQTLSQTSSQAAPTTTTAQSLNTQSQPLPVHVGPQDPASAMFSARKQQEGQPLLPIPSASVPLGSLQSQPMPPHPLQSMQQSKGHLSGQQGLSMSVPQSSQIHSMPPLPIHSAAQPPSHLQSQVSMMTGQQPQSFSSSAPHMPLQPPLPPQPRPPMLQPFQHQIHSQMGPHMGFQSSGAPQQPHLQQPPFSSGKPPGSISSSFPPLPPPMQSQPMLQSMYQAGGPHVGPEFNGHGGSSMQIDRPSWMPGQPENPTIGTQLPGPPPLPGQMNLANQPGRPQQLTPDMEKALLQQVMSLTPEQINLLPPEHRNQVLQLQQMLR